MSINKILQNRNWGKCYEGEPHGFDKGGFWLLQDGQKAWPCCWYLKDKKGLTNWKGVEEHSRPWKEKKIVSIVRATPRLSMIIFCFCASLLRLLFCLFKENKKFYCDVVDVSCNSPIWSIQINSFQYIHRYRQPLLLSFSEHFHDLRKKHLVIHILPPHSPSLKQPLHLISVSIDLPVLDISSKWNHTARGPFCLIFFHLV